jgi:hypothetical protein
MLALSDATEFETYNLKFTSQSTISNFERTMQHVSTISQPNFARAPKGNGVPWELANACNYWAVMGLRQHGAQVALPQPAPCCLLAFGE